jgi:peptide/nickel transport system ATP-binding protein
MSPPVLAVSDLKTHFFLREGIVKAVDGVSLTVGRGEVLGLVGESGSGKTVTGWSIIGLLDPPGRIVEGSIRLAGDELVGCPEDKLRQYRGRKIAMIFQDPMMTLNPVLRIDTQMIEAVTAHEQVSQRAARARARTALAAVGIAAPDERLKAYPHQLSGGMRQRVMIAMALSCNPKLLIADEPTTALDVTIQAQILELMQDMKERFGMAIMLITHAMGVVAETCQRVTVMYAGKIVEEAPVEALFGDPRHPYTQGLIRSIPRIDRAVSRQARLESISGTVPSLLNPPPGCRFAARCKYAMDICTQAIPPLKEVAPGHRVACVL